jgi:hypothetical protein
MTYPRTDSWRDDFEPGTPAPVAHALHLLRSAPVWPFPPPKGPVPWTPQQVRQYARQHKQPAPDAPEALL